MISANDRKVRGKNLQPQFMSLFSCDESSLSLSFHAAASDPAAKHVPPCKRTAWHFTLLHPLGCPSLSDFIDHDIWKHKTVFNTWDAVVNTAAAVCLDLQKFWVRGCGPVDHVDRWCQSTQPGHLGHGTGVLRDNQAYAGSRRRKQKSSRLFPTFS